MSWVQEEHYCQRDKINIQKSPDGHKYTDTGQITIINYNLNL